MGAPVDVLAVMDRFTTTVLPVKLWNGANEYCSVPWREGPSEYSNDLAALYEARAAVAELIEAAHKAGVRLSLSMQHTEDLVAHMRLCAAIARVQGCQP